jgi:hypothetical protein
LKISVIENSVREDSKLETTAFHPLRDPTTDPLPAANLSLSGLNETFYISPEHLLDQLVSSIFLNIL